MSAIEITLADIWATTISPEGHPIAHLRQLLDDFDIIPIDRLGPSDDRRRVQVAGLVTHRQRPSTAGGVTFINLEDETGMLNVVCAQALWQRYRRVAGQSAGLVIRGVVEHHAGVTNLLADRLQPLSSISPQARAVLPGRYRSRDFR
jgi:error-prone DNA polymerase